MFQLKPLSRDAIARSLERAHQYRVLNEPVEAESICLDVLCIDPQNHDAMITLLLARTDQFGSGVTDAQAREVLPQLAHDYERAYYAGIICERRAKARLRQGAPGAGFDAYQWFREAMAHYERADALKPAGNDDAVLRWNTCARILMRSPELQPRSEERVETMLE
jgi:hypothetical protein